MVGSLSEINFQLMVEASPTALILTDNKGTVAYLNHFAEDILAYSKDELIGKGLHILFPERLHSEYCNLFFECFKHPKSIKLGADTELYAQKKNGREFPVEIGLNPIKTENGTMILVAIVDITDTINANEQFKLIVESSPNAILLTNELGQIEMVNKQAEKLFGYTRKELLNNRIEMLIPPRFKEKHPHYRDIFFHTPQPRPMGAGRDLFALKKDGREIPIEIGLTPIKKDNNNYVLASIIDITERKKHEEALSSYTKKIEAKNKELEQFTSIASHDLKEPLNTITSAVQIILKNEKYEDDEDIKHFVEYMDDSMQRMRELIENLLDYSRLGINSKMEKANINSIVKEVIGDLKSVLQEYKAEITVDELPTALVFKLELRLLFQNLINNAIKYSHKDRRPTIHISCAENKNEFIFAVKDNGIGISERYFNKIFLLFERLHEDDEYSGTGIGLAHCKKIVDMHDGSIWLESEVNAGSSFYFSIPKR